MERRKFIAGLGSLTAAGAAGIGTGAFTTASAERQVEVRVASDASGYVGLYDTDSPYSSVEDGQISLDFSEISPENGPGAGTFDNGKGLNPDATYNFDDLFRVANQAAGGNLRIVITTSGFNLEDLEITTNEPQGGATSLLAEDYDDPQNVPKLVQPDSLTANMTIETKDSTDNDAGGTITIHAARSSNYEDSSFSDLV